MSKERALYSRGANLALWRGRHLLDHIVFSEQRPSTVITLHVASPIQYIHLPGSHCTRYIGTVPLSRSSRISRIRKDAGSFAPQPSLLPTPIRGPAGRSRAAPPRATKTEVTEEQKSRRIRSEDIAQYRVGLPLLPADVIQN